MDVRVQSDEGWDAVGVVDVILVFRVAVRDERRWVVGVGVVGNYEVVLCDGMEYVELVWVGVVVLRGWLCGCVLAGVEGECMGDGGNALVADVVFHLVVDVGVAARRWRLSWAGGCGKVGVVTL